MSLFQKNYSNLSKEELAAIEEYNAADSKGTDTGLKGFKLLTKEAVITQMKVLLKFPFIKNLQSLFPNHHLNSFHLQANKLGYIKKLQNFIQLVDDPNITERDILNYIRNEEAHFIISSALKFTDFGHHDRYVFQEVSLPPNHQADFLVVGKNSNGYHFLLFELENPYKGITTKDGSFGTTIRKGLSQIDDWKTWMDKNFTTLKNVLLKVKNPSLNLPPEFYEYDNTRFQYVVVAGRRENFSEKTYRLSRTIKRQGTIVIHYDNLIDESKTLIEAGRY
ncbi:DUF4263 domain-containing protein [Flavobacterium sp. LS1P28]|uniref:Shedu anti-phage system protein SduA domain-containing protein n=1 Tax=Flavobacterium sp. LS1P28 TaxID=2497752 RepID=UPI000F81ABA7|nr:Shedu anti-phage system protein SduA domain-containing protein [Flavobacterium sp. LS1P28]RTY78837.1 DUF4263 domain-containing protein [Flavobacterium sp. LS1P28]